MSFARTIDQEADLPRAIYYGDTYFAEKQLYSLSKQISEVYAFRPRSVLEIGKGNGFVSEFLKRSGLHVVTVDVNPELGADFTMDIRDIKKAFSKDAFDCTLCAEVLEHLPFTELKQLVSCISKVSKVGAVITLPRADKIRWSCGVRFKLPRVGLKTLEFNIPSSKKRRRIYEGHHWEINHAPETSLKNIRSILLAEFSDCRDFRFTQNAYHHYFSLTK